VTAVAVIGLGAMGSRIARRLVDARYDVVVWNRSAAKVQELLSVGAQAAASPADAARRSQTVITMVADPAALQAVSEGSDGIAPGLGESKTVIDMSTVGPAAVNRLASALPRGTSLLDAPVLGSLAEAESGTLAIFVGGKTVDFERSMELLRVLGSPIHMGPLGSGAAAKLIANFTLFGVLGVLGESVAAADALGLSRDVVFQLLATTPIAAQAERRRPAIERNEYPPRFRLALAKKDVDLLAEAAEGLELRVFQAARSWLTDAAAAGRGAVDYSAMLAQIIESNSRIGDGERTAD
jgi:3-hydroxyisobutyrate dehydrogenase-like beta-hydroxyacid dehydrogenase